MDTAAVLGMMQEVAEAVVRPRWRALSDEHIDQKKPGDYVTIADHESEIEITARLQAAYPGALIVGEEATAANPGLLRQLEDAEHAFVVDPVDGTRNFVQGKREYAVMVGEVIGGESVRGWIWQPELDQAFVVERGAGVTCNGRPLSRPAPDLHALRGATSHRRLIGRHPAGIDTRIGPTAWCCGVDYPNVCLDRIDYLIFKGMKPWDHVPGTLMVTELGGVARTFDRVDYTATVDSPPLLTAASAEAWDIAREGLDWN